MAPAPSKIVAPPATQTNSEKAGPPRKRKASSRITDDNFVGAESNAVTKRLKLLADATARASRATAVNHLQRQASVEEVEEDNTSSGNNAPKNVNTVLEAADGSDDPELLGNDPSQTASERTDEPGGGDDEYEDGEPWITKPVETPREQRRESNNPLLEKIT